MERKYKSKDQKKIERLEAKLTETEAELSQVKKDRKRLNYAVERLERAIQKLTINLTVNSASNTSSTECSSEVKQTGNNAVPIQSEDVSTDIQASSTEEEEIYTLNVAWIVEEVPEEIIRELEHFYKCSGMVKIGETDFVLNKNQTERTISYWMEPGYLGCVEVGKRMTNAELKVITDPESRYRITYYAQKVK